MNTLNQSIINTMKSVLISNGMLPADANYQLDDADSILVTNLPASCLVPNNRSTKTCKQTHIHFTGESMKFFYSQNILNNPPLELSTDVSQSLTLSKSNIISLYQSYNSPVPSFISNYEHEFIPSFTAKKLGHHYTQVQLSKLRYDDRAFLSLRNILYENDVLIFVKKSNSDNYFTFAIHCSSFKPLHIQPGLYCRTTLPTYNTSNNIQVNNEDFNSTSPSQLREVTPDQIAQFNPNDDITNSATFDLSEGINSRRDRTDRHQHIVQLIAKTLSQFQYRLYEYPMDCLAIKDNDSSLLFEVKTLDGTASDERSQVMKAFSQLYYYEYFNLPQTMVFPIRKIAFFEHSISTEHIAFLQHSNIDVYWLNEHDQIIRAPQVNE